MGAGLRKWTIRLALLDNRELSALVAFVEQQGSTVFSFADPLSGVVAAKCVIGGDRFSATASGELTAQGTVLIEEIA